MGLVRYKVKEKEISEVVGNSLEKKKIAVIYEEYINDNGVSIEIPSSLNRYLRKWKEVSINNAKNIADTLCPFLNYVKMQVIEDDDENFNILKEKGLYGLNFYHAASYIQHCISVKKNKLSTVEQYTIRILDFYDYLVDLDVLDKKQVKFKYITRTINGVPRKFRKNPLKEEPYYVAYPSKENAQLRKIVNMEEHLWLLFLDISEKYAPDITFGIALQMFGGLRRGEIVNLIISDIKTTSTKDKSKMDVFIRDRIEELFKDRTDIELAKCSVKKPRNQTVFNFNSKLYKYYENHLINRNKLLSENKRITPALFVDKEGQAMSGVRYEQRWGKVKKEFLKALELDSYSSYIGLSKFIWGTHIGRGIFTNLCLTYGLAKDSRTLANLRGDKYLYSSQPYIDEFKKAKIITQTLNIMAEDVEGR